MSYQVSRQGRQLGVFSLKDIRDKLASGELLADDLAKTEDMADWLALGELTSDAPRSPQAETPAVAAKYNARFRRRSRPANNLVGAIIVTLFFPPFGIPAIVYASQVNGKYSGGDYSGARKAAQKAKTWIRISVGAVLFGIFAYAVLLLLDGIMIN